MRMLERVGTALALIGLAALPGCYEFDQVFPWNWHVPRKIEPYERLPGKTDVEKKRREELQEEGQLQGARRKEPEAKQESGSGDDLDTAQAS